VKRLQSIPGVVIPEPDGAFYALPDMTAFFGPDVEADGFGSIQDADTLCRQATRDCYLLLPPTKQCPMQRHCACSQGGCADCTHTGLTISIVKLHEILYSASDQHIQVPCAVCCHKVMLFTEGCSAEFCSHVINMSANAESSLTQCSTDMFCLAWVLIKVVL